MNPEQEAALYLRIEALEVSIKAHTDMLNDLSGAVDTIGKVNNALSITQGEVNDLKKRLDNLEG